MVAQGTKGLVPEAFGHNRSVEATAFDHHVRVELLQTYIHIHIHTFVGENGRSSGFSEKNYIHTYIHLFIGNDSLHNK